MKADRNRRFGRVPSASYGADAPYAPTAPRSTAIRGQAARVAETDAKLLAAGAVLAGRATAPGGSDLARASGVDPGTMKASLGRLKARGEWPYEFPVDGRCRNRAGAARRSAGRTRAAWAPSAMPAPPKGPRVAPAAYLGGGERKPVDMDEAKAACKAMIAAWKRGTRALGRVAYSEAHPR